MFDYKEEKKELKELSERKDMNVFSKLEKAMNIVSPLILSKQQKMKLLEDMGLGSDLLNQFYQFMKPKLRKPTLTSILEALEEE